MSKIQIKKTKDNKYIFNKLVYPESINERVYKDIEMGKYDYMLPLDIEKKGKDIKLFVDVSLMLSFSQFFDGWISKKMFLNVVKQIVEIIKKCEQNHININNLDLQIDRIFFLPQQNKVKCIYWPIVNNQCEEQPYKFFKDFPNQVKFNANDDVHFLAEYKAFFCDGNPFSINNFEKLIEKLQGNILQEKVMVPQSISDIVETKKQNLNKNIEYDPFENDKEVFVPVLIRKKNYECVQIGSSRFLIGSDMNCDFVIDNRYVSKIHAVICADSGRFFITDQNSTNKTYISDVQICAGETREIFDNSEIRIANEEFVFKFI